MTNQPQQPQQNKLEHRCFPQPGDTSIRVWRYLDLAKFVWLLENKKLYLSRLDLLNDPHEGSTPPFVVTLRDQQLCEPDDKQLVTLMQNLTQQNRKATYINCWRIDNAESEAMWRLYCPGDSGVAIQTTYSKLVDSIQSDPSCYIGCVTYIDYESEGFPPNNMFYPVMHKRISFGHEHEVRLVKGLIEFNVTPGPAGPSGITLDWSPETTVDAVYVNPYAPSFYHDVVKTIVRKLAPTLESRVIWSPMRAAPVY